MYIFSVLNVSKIHLNLIKLSSEINQSLQKLCFIRKGKSSTQQRILKNMQLD